MKDNRFFTRTFLRIAENVLRFRWLLVILVLGLTVFFIYRMQDLELATENEIWFIEGDRTLELLNRFEELFGNDDFVYILVESDDFFNAEHIRLLGALAEDLKENVPYVKEVTWLGNVEYIEGFADRIDIYELIEDIPETPEEMSELRRKALSEKTYLNALISPDGKTAGLLLELDAYPEDRKDPRKEVPPAVRSVLARPAYRELLLYAVGTPLMDYDIDVVTARESALFMVICLAVQIGILFWVGRDFRGVAAPLLVMILSIVWTMGVIAVLGFGLNIFIIMIPVLLICVGIGDSMHLISEYHDQLIHHSSSRQSMIRAAAKVGLPCLLTSLTTAAGFLSFLAARIKPFREMGVYTAIGVVIALVLTFVIIPMIYSIKSKDGRADVNNKETRQRNDLFDRLLAGIHRTVTAYPKSLALAFVILSALSIIGYCRVEVESNMLRMLSTDIPIRRAYDYVDSHMGGSMSMEILLDTGKPDGVKDPEFLKQLDGLDRFLAGQPLISKTISVLDILKQMNRAVNENQQEYYRVPDTRKQASQYLLLYEMEGGEESDDLVTFDYDIAHLTARTQTVDTRDTREMMDQVKEYAAQNIDAEVKVEFAGMAGWIVALNDLIGKGQKKSFAVAGVVITLIMILVLRSVRLGLVSMIPNVFPVLITLGLMGYMGIYLDLALMTFAAVIIGVAVDDTIHFFVRYKQEFARAGNYSDALKATLSTVGRPIVFTTLTLTLGFSVLALSNVNGIVNFGLLAGFAFTWALLADLFFAPALIMLIRPLGPERVEAPEPDRDLSPSKNGGRTSSIDLSCKEQKTMIKTR